MSINIATISQEKPKLVVICGPTGTGKTAVAVEIGQVLQAEIIGADSMQVYKYMDIGTAKPTPAEQQAVRHHMIDVVAPDEPFDAARFASKAHERINQIHARGQKVFVVGGTGLYIKALLYGLFEHDDVDLDLRRQLQAEADQHGSAFLHRRLRSADPQSAANIHPNDTYRIIRALEIHQATRKPLIEHQRAHGFAEQTYEVLKVGLQIERQALYERIDQRVDAMIAARLKDEVQMLLEKGYDPGLKAMQSIGYRHVAAYLGGQLTWEEAVRTMKRDTRRYAKRQMTWFRADEDIVWKKPQEVEQIQTLVQNFF